MRLVWGGAPRHPPPQLALGRGRPRGRPHQKVMAEVEVPQGAIAGSTIKFRLSDGRWLQANGEPFGSFRLKNEVIAQNDGVIDPVLKGHGDSRLKEISALE